MRTLEEFLNEYAKTHMNPVNSAIHMICVPIIVVFTLGLAWGLTDLIYGTALAGKTIGGIDAFLLLNGGTLGALFMLQFYARLNIKLLAFMAVFIAFSLWVLYSLHIAGQNVLLISAVVWVAAWVGQFIGHHVEGAKPSFTDDLVFLFIGPAFVLNKVLRKTGGAWV